MNEEERRKYEAFQYWIQTNTEKGVTTIPDTLCLFVVNLINKLQKENEQLSTEVNSLKKENEEKDKIIDLLIKELYTKAHISTRCYLQTSTEECMKYKNCYECLKKHFEKKAKGLK